MLDLLFQFVRIRLQKLRSLQELFFQLFIINRKSFCRQGLYSSDSCCHTSLRKDLKCTDGPGVCHMCSSTELDRKISHADYPYDVSILFTEQRSRTGLFRFLDRHIFHLDIQMLPDLFIDDILYLLKFFCRQCRKMRKVETQPVSIHRGPCLLYMRPQYHSESFMKQMRSAVVVGRQRACLFIYQELRGISYLDHTFGYTAHMSDLASQELDHILHLEFAFCGADHSLVRLLAAAGGIKRRLTNKQSTGLSFCQGVYKLCLRSKHGNL